MIRLVRHRNPVPERSDQLCHEKAKTLMSFFWGNRTIFENIVGQAAVASLDFSSFICKCFGMEPLLLQLSFHLQSKNH